MSKFLSFHHWLKWIKLGTKQLLLFLHTTVQLFHLNKIYAHISVHILLSISIYTDWAAALAFMFLHIFSFYYVYFYAPKHKADSSHVQTCTAINLILILILFPEKKKTKNMKNISSDNKEMKATLLVSIITRHQTHSLP